MVNIRKMLVQYQSEVQEELDRILSFWSTVAVDSVYGGFIGALNNEHVINERAAKGAVLNSRILWIFAAAYNAHRNPRDLDFAKRAYEYIKTFFIDDEFGGIYWTVSFDGKPLDTKKQVYAQCFCIYGLSEYFLATGDEQVLELAIHIYQVVVHKSIEPEFGGYIEAFSREWNGVEDLRLSKKDANERKTMNTHLHVIEGFANLYKVWPDTGLKEKIIDLLEIFRNHIIDADTHHLKLFFNDAWEKQGNIISYGHDIEAAWLLQECAEIIGDEKWIKEMKQMAMLVTDASMEGLDSDDGMWHEFDMSTGFINKEKHWWPQAEAMVGFFNAWQLSARNEYLQRSLTSWQFVKKHLIDFKKGEWYWGITTDYALLENEDKAGLWKCPYHNGRACMEIIKRVQKTIL